MQQDQEQPATTLPPGQKKPTSTRKKLIVVVTTSVIVIVLAVVAMVIYNSMRGSQGNKDQSVKPLTVGSQPYIYPCSVATRQDYAQIFGLDDEKVGTVTERSALPEKDLKKGGDLSKLAPGSSADSRYSTDCSYTLAKKGAQQVNRIDVELLQLATDEQAVQEFNTARNRAARVFGPGETANLPALSSFTTENSFVKTPEQGGNALTAGLLVGTRFVEIEYHFTDTDTAETVMPLIDQYAQVIKVKLNTAKSKPIDLTGLDTFVGTKFIDICRNTDLSRLAEIFNGIEFRPDEVTDISTYGSLAGSRAAADGAESDCMLAFNSREDQKKIAELDAKPKKSKYDTPLSSDARWQHNMMLSLNTFNSKDEAKAALDNQKTIASKPVANTTSDVKDITGVGDAAFKLTRTIDHSLGIVGGGTDVRKTTETNLVVVAGKDLYVVNLQQVSVDDDYKTTPVELNDDQLKDAYRLVKETVEKNRS
jgi:hypothetical protein